MNSPKSVIESARKQRAKMVDVKFADVFGTWQRFSVPVSELTGDVFTDGLDGSSIRKWKSIEAPGFRSPRPRSLQPPPARQSQQFACGF